MSTEGEHPGGEALLERASRVELVVFDVDGVLTDGGLYYGPAGEAYKRFDVRDGHGMVLARLVGLRLALLTGRSSEAVAVRARELGVHSVLQGQRDKRSGLRVLLEEHGLPSSACAYMGDDWNDLPALSEVGLPACPCDAAAEVRARAAVITRARGGQGAARELLELVLRATGRLEQAMSFGVGSLA